MNKAITNQELFYFFLRYKIDSGVKQIDLFRSDYINISPSYLNKLYLHPPKTCATEIQASIAKYFDLTYDEMLAKAKRLYKEQSEQAKELHGFKAAMRPPEKKNNTERRFYDPKNLVDQLTFVTDGIRTNQNYTDGLEQERDDLLSLLNDLQTGICVADSELKVIYQNPCHRKMFGNKTGIQYSIFWDKDLSKQEIYGKLTTGTYEALQVDHENKRLQVQFSLKYKGNRVDKIVEHVIDLHEEAGRNDESDREQLQLYTQIFKELDHDFGFFNNNRELELASNKFGLLDEYDFPNKRPSVDQLLLELGYKMNGGLEKIAMMKKAYENRKEINFDLEIEDIPYNFQTRNIKAHDKYLGILLIARKLEK